MKGSSVLQFGVSPMLVLVCLLLVGSCKKKIFETKDDFMAYTLDPINGLRQGKSVHGVNLSIVYRPTDLLVQQELSGEASEHQVDSLRKKYGKYMYFILSISKNNDEILNNVSQSRSDFGAMVNQLSFGMGDKVHLISKTRDTLELLDFNYPRIFGMGGSTNILFVYPRNTKALNEKYLQLTIEDIGLNIGEVGFKIPTGPINDEPNLNFE